MNRSVIGPSEKHKANMSNEGSERQVAKMKAMNSRNKVKGENKLNNERIKR